MDKNARLASSTGVFLAAIHFPPSTIHYARFNISSVTWSSRKLII
jgi:hypothetical protein